VESTSVIDININQYNPCSILIIYQRWSHIEIDFAFTYSIQGKRNENLIST
jgi:hypothetical protein